MRLELAVFAVFCAFVPQVLSQMDMSLLMSVMNPELKPPPTLPKFLASHYHTRQQAALQQQKEKRRRQEMQLFRQLRSMNKTQLEQFKSTLKPWQLHQLVRRLQYLVRHQDPASSSNVVLSGASPVRQPGKPANSVGRHGASGGNTRSPSSHSSPSPRRTPSPRRHPLYYLQKYRKAGISARADQCAFPFPDYIKSFFLFRGRGCARGGNYFCSSHGLASGMPLSCVDVHQSVLCCPFGMTPQSLEMMRYMRDMQHFMQQFQ